MDIIAFQKFVYRDALGLMFLGKNITKNNRIDSYII